MDGARLLAEWRRLAQAGANNRAAAAALGVSEAALLAAAEGHFTTRLKLDAALLLVAIRDLGTAKYVVRNDYAVMERAGEIVSIDATATGLSVSGSTFVLQLDASQVASAFALEEPRDAGIKRSVQLFDTAGVTLLKVVVKPGGSDTAYRRLVAAMLDDGTRACETTLTPPANGTSSPTATSLPFEGLAEFLQEAARSGGPVEWTVANAGASLSTEASISRVRRSSRAPWINVLDPGLDLHLYEARIRGFADVPAAPGRRSVQWLSDDSLVAMTTSAAPEAYAFQETANGLRERAVQD